MKIKPLTQLREMISRSLSGQTNLSKSFQSFFIETMELMLTHTGSHADKVVKLSNKQLFDLSIGRRVLSSQVSDSYTIPVYSANVFEPFGKIEKSILDDFSMASVIWGIDGDWMVNTIPADTPFNPTDHCGVLRVKTDYILPEYLAWLLKKAGEVAGFKRSYRASIDRVEALSIQIAPIDRQKAVVAQVKKQEDIIKKAEGEIAGCMAKKKKIMDKWLK